MFRVFFYKKGINISFLRLEFLKQLFKTAGKALLLQTVVNEQTTAPTWNPAAPE